MSHKNLLWVRMANQSRPRAADSGPASNPEIMPPQIGKIVGRQNAQKFTLDQARAELEMGQKQSHWMWFIFPKTKGLCSSPTAQRFAISSLDEGAAYLEHRVLGRRLEASTA